MLTGKVIVVGVTGGIAAYKAVELVSRLRKQRADVQVVMSKGATNFVTPLTFREISGNPVIVDMWEEPKSWNVEHIALAQRADAFVIAPATANLLGKLANGLADDSLSTTLMATKAPVLLAPAMNCNMYLNPLVQQNIARLKTFGYQFIEPDCGMLACGVEGPGRLPEPQRIVEALQQMLASSTALAGVKVLVTAGGTREAIDPVRYIGNRSSGKMGYALAAAAAKLGADVVLVSGPVAIEDPAGVRVIRIESAQQMMESVLAEFADSRIVIKAAAVADYRPQSAAPHKIKKHSEQLTLVLEKTPDILAELGRLKRDDQLLVGFAAETQELIEHARGKLQRKNLDMIVANDVSLPGAGFNSDTNIVKLLYADGRQEELPQLAKTELARQLLQKIIALTKK